MRSSMCYVFPRVALYKVMRLSLEMYKTADSETVRSHIGRTTGGLFFVSGKDFLDAGEIWVGPKLMILVNYKQKKALVIRDPIMTVFVYNLMSLLFDGLEIHTAIHRIDMNSFFKKLLDEREARVT